MLNDADKNVLDGWVREEVGVTPWVSPWSWEGYDIIFTYDTPRDMLAFFLLTVKRLSQAQEERYGPMVDDKYKVRVQKRLYDIIDRNRDGKMTAEELQAAIRLPAHAQSISQLIIHGESEWYYRAPPGTRWMNYWGIAVRHRI
ncbi:EF-hand domain-containing protein [Pseudomonas sp. PCH446]